MHNTNLASSVSVWQNVYGEELYDHSTDAEENTNLAKHENYQEIKKHLKNMLEQKNGHVSTICRISAESKSDSNSFC